MSILITGANGQLGKHIIRELLQKVPASRIIACVRRPDQAAEYREQGIEVRFGDYDQPDSLQDAFAGVSSLLLISSSHSDDSIRIAQHTRVIEAAQKAGVNHLLYTSFAFPAKDPIPPGHVHLLTEQAVHDSGIPYTILRNALYTDFVGVLNLNEAVRSGKLITYPGDWKFNTMIREDLAAATAAVLASGIAGNHTYELAAPRTWEFAELAAVLSELSGQPVRHIQDARVQNWIYGFLGKINTSSTSADLENLLNRPATSLRDSILPFIHPR